MDDEAPDWMLSLFLRKWEEHRPSRRAMMKAIQVIDDTPLVNADGLDISHLRDEIRRIHTNDTPATYEHQGPTS